MKLRGAKLKQVEQERLECVLQSAVVSAHPGVERLRFRSACGDNALAVLLLSQWRDRGCVVGERERERHYSQATKNAVTVSLVRQTA